MPNAIAAVTSDRSRRRTTRTFAVSINFNYANPGPNLLDLTTATDPTRQGAGIAGILDPGDVAAGLMVPKVVNVQTPFITGGAAYRPSVQMNPSGSATWPTGLLFKLINEATGAELANATAITGTFILELSGPNGKF